MKLMQIDNRKTRELELISEPIENILFNDKKYANSTNKLFQITGWIHFHGMDANDPQKKHLEKLIALLNYKPNYKAQYLYRNAVWGLFWETNLENTENNKFIIYKSKKGTSIQLHPEFRKDMIEQFVDELHDLLLGINQNV